MSASELTGFEPLVRELRGATLHAPDSLRARILAPAPRRAPRTIFSRRVAYAVLPVAAALAVTAAVVHGIVGSGSGRPVAGAARHKPVEYPVAASGGAVDSASVPATPVQTLTTLTGATQSLQPFVPSAGTSRLQHTDATLAVRVPDVARLSAATNRATAIATSLGGYAQSVVYATGRGGSATLVLRVPAENVRIALARLSTLGTLVSQQVSVQDLEEALRNEAAQIGELRRTVAALATAVRNPSLPDAQRVILQIRLAQARRALAERLHARGGTIAAAATARIELTLTTAKSSGVVVHRRGRLGRMIHSAVGFLALEATVALYVLIAAGPLALVAAALWFLNRARRRRQENRLLAA
ncbi:MAG: DUF4349 domain-containing protein [Gaiellaceae bacterium]